jgi:galactose mutarotase-like enzyme
MISGTVEQAKQAITLVNENLKLTIRPDLGSRIDQLLDCKTGREWLWHPAQYDTLQTRSLPIGASFDDNWTGGWDEIFPNDAAGPFREYTLVDHGELWSQPWKVIETSPLLVKLTYQCQTVPVLVEKTVRLHETQPEVVIEYRFENQSDKTIPFLFKQHAAIAIQEGDEILLPDCLIEPAFPEFSKIIGRAKKTPFPKAFAADGQEINVRKIPPRSSKLQEFYYSSNLAEGMCGIYDARSQSSLVMNFDTSDFPYVWVFQSYGGWNDHYVVVLEPCTTIPYDLEIASRNGTTAQLKPQETQHRTLTLRLGT